MSLDTKRLLIQGRVQGVGYRYFFNETANSLGLTGWVRNRRDGSVEAVVQGDALAVEQIIAIAFRGPSMARVDDIDVSQVSGEFSTFAVRDTE